MNYTFTAPSISCNHCKQRIEKTLLDSNQVSLCKVDIAKKTIIVESTLDKNDIVKMLEGIGHKPV